VDLRGTFTAASEVREALPMSPWNALFVPLHRDLSWTGANEAMQEYNLAFSSETDNYIK
jgi:hypothetical protein